MSSADDERIRAEFTANNEKDLADYILAKLDQPSRKRLLNEFEEFGGLKGLREAYTSVAETVAKMTGSGSPGSDDSAKTSPISPPVKITSLPADFEFTAAVNQLALSAMDPKELAELHEIGLKAIRDGKVAVVTLAGGQGTRLGVSCPKGVVSINLPSDASLFEVIAKRLRRLQELAGGESGRARLPWYIMTSEINNDDTVKHFEEHEHFGLRKEDVIFFKQNMLPSFDVADGHVLLAGPDSLIRSPNGNGGVFQSLATQGLIERMRQSGVEYLHVIGVDNVLSRIGDPVFMGACIRAKAEVGNRCLKKRSPDEKVGVQVIRHRGGRDEPCVIEYSELSDEQANMKDAKNPDELAFSCANVLSHFFKLSFVSDQPLEYHPAIKKVKYHDYKTGQNISPEKPNAVKIEMFIFDKFTHAKHLLALEGERANEFSPVKNMSGLDSPETARKDLLALHRKWLVNAGLIKEDDPREFEIKAGETYEGEGLTDLERQCIIVEPKKSAN